MKTVHARRLDHSQAGEVIASFVDVVEIRQHTCVWVPSTCGHISQLAQLTQRWRKSPELQLRYDTCFVTHFEQGPIALCDHRQRYRGIATMGADRRRRHARPANGLYQRHVSASLLKSGSAVSFRHRRSSSQIRSHSRPSFRHRRFAVADRQACRRRRRISAGRRSTVQCRRNRPLRLRGLAQERTVLPANGTHVQRKSHWSKPTLIGCPCVRLVPRVHAADAAAAEIKKSRRVFIGLGLSKIAMRIERREVKRVAALISAVALRLGAYAHVTGIEVILVNYTWRTRMLKSVVVTMKPPFP